MGFSPEQRERARQRSRLTRVKRRVETYKTGEPKPTDSDVWELAAYVADGFAPPSAEVRDWLRRMLDTSSGVPS